MFSLFCGMEMKFGKEYLPLRFSDGTGIIHTTWKDAFAEVTSLVDYLMPSQIRHPERYVLGREFPQTGGWEHIFPVNTTSPMRYAFPKSIKNKLVSGETAEKILADELGAFVRHHAIGLPVPFPVGLIEINRPGVTPHRLLTEYHGCDTLHNAMDRNCLEERIYATEKYAIAKAKSFGAVHQHLILRSTIPEIIPDRHERFLFHLGKSRKFSKLYDELTLTDDNQHRLNKKLRAVERKLEKKLQLTEYERTKLIENVARGLGSFSKKGVFLKDIAPRQIVVKANLDPVFVDFEDTVEKGSPLSSRERRRQFKLFANRIDWSSGERELFEKTYLSAN